jgi:predicted RNA methylase
VLILETGTEWKPPREQVKRAWRELLRRGELPRTWIRDEISEYNAGYIAAILAALPGVTYQTEPIRLFYRPTGEPKPTPLPKPAFEVPDIGIRHVVSPIPFPAGELPEWLFDEPAWNRLFGEGQPSLWRPTWTREDLDEALMQLIADKEANRFVTPRQVVDFMVNLAQPKPGERVADTCCGTGIFLVKALRFVKEVYGADADLELYGADIYDKAVEATRLNLQANGARNFTVVRADSLRGQVGLFSQKYDLILGNPPFGGGQAQAFLRRWHDLLISDGRLVVNVPDGVLSSSGTISISTRSWLAENLEIELVTSLPRPNDYERYGTKSNVFYARHRQSQEHITILAQANDYGSLSAMLSITHKPD